MTQADLFAPPAEVRSCGSCVARNARTPAEPGHCPEGLRHGSDPACGRWFGLDQLRLACARRPQERATGVTA